jgi:hypothetical protein
MLKVVVSIFFGLVEREPVSDSALDYKDSMNLTGCGS